MKVRTSLAAAGAAAVLSVTGAFSLPALASAHSSTHTLKFTSVQKAMASFTGTTLGQQDTDVNTAGKTVGFDEIYLAAISSSTAAANYILDTKGGILDATFTVNFKTGVVTDGKVTGGTGAFAGATGTFTAKALNTAATKYAVTVTYSG
jgi:hypothetical protein